MRTSSTSITAFSSRRVFIFGLIGLSACRRVIAAGRIGSSVINDYPGARRRSSDIHGRGEEVKTDEGIEAHRSVRGGQARINVSSDGCRRQAGRAPCRRADRPHSRDLPRAVRSPYAAIRPSTARSSSRRSSAGKSLRKRALAENRSSGAHRRRRIGDTWPGGCARVRRRVTRGASSRALSLPTSREAVRG